MHHLALTVSTNAQEEHTIVFLNKVYANSVMQVIIVVLLDSKTLIRVQ